VVVSAGGAETDRLLARIESIGERARADARSGGAMETNGAGPDRALAREIDRVLATGEDRSAGLLALALCALSVPARSLRGGEAGVGGVGEFGAGNVERVETTLFRELLAGGIVPVVSGFQAVRADGETLTLGRGGSDISAVAIAAALDAVVCHIVTDVDAVYDRDPRLDPDARALAALEHAELVALTESGAEVVHRRAALLAARHELPLRVYRYDAPHGAPGPDGGPGTWIGRAVDQGAPARPVTAARIERTLNRCEPIEAV
jgi:aspartate kinase